MNPSCIGKVYSCPAGPDICGYSTKKVHVIFNYKGVNHLIKKEIKCKVILSFQGHIVNVNPPSKEVITPALITMRTHSPSVSCPGRRADTSVHPDPEPGSDL